MSLARCDGLLMWTAIKCLGEYAWAAKAILFSSTQCCSNKGQRAKSTEIKWTFVYAATNIDITDIVIHDVTFEVMFLSTHPWGATKLSTFANKQVHFPSAVTCFGPFCRKLIANQSRKCLFKYLMTASGVAINRPIKARNEITAGEIRSQKL